MISYNFIKNSTFETYSHYLIFKEKCVYNSHNYPAIEFD